MRGGLDDGERGGLDGGERGGLEGGERGGLEGGEHLELDRIGQKRGIMMRGKMDGERD